ncbi:GntR family transcriptional regulator [Chromobacterium alkanivorans]|uniref:GntR family transcriptional regulator n=1 Tax=Chromobacterium alkanivorans TaxID=1071719 RepID=UPI001967C146|nr:GntR family transcriptional regulator [Chromobacterium alkanivorans]MBN3004045.1 GntR family transcriptional regulator [Chromobacterium alkanivorans]
MLHSANGTSAATAPRASTLVGDGAPSNDADRLYWEIFDAVIDQRLLPGVKLTEAVLCDAFQCSRSSARSALAQLAHDKIVDIQPNRGAFVAKPDEKETRDVFEARRMVEAAILDKLLALPDLAARLPPMRRMVADERAAFERGDRVSWIRLSNAFHVQLARLADNEVLTELMHGLCSRTSLIIALYDVPGRSACSFDEHEAILTRLEAGDRAGAAAAMHHHLEDCERRMKVEAPGRLDPWTVFNLKR